MDSGAQVPTWQQATAVLQTAANGSESEVKATATDANGNVYVTGYFRGTVSLGSTTLVSAGFFDMFVAKWSRATGTFVWALKAGGAADELPVAIAINGANVYVGGTHAGTTTFGSITLPSANNNHDAFVTKLVDAGTTASFVWAQGGGGSADESVVSMAAAGPNIYLIGRFNSALATFGGITLTNINGTSGDDMYVAKLTDTGTSGRYDWALRSGTQGTYPGGIAVDGTAVYLAGYFSGATTTLGAGTLANSGSVGTADVFVAKLLDAGSAASWVWAQRGGDTGHEVAKAIRVAGSNVYVAGDFQGSTTRFGNTVLTNAGPGGFLGADVFVAKLTDAGSTAAVAWALRAGGAANDVVSGLAVRGTGVYLAGSYSSLSADFGGITLANLGSTDAFVSKLVDGGATAGFVWAQSAGGAGADLANTVSADGSYLCVGGLYQPTASFGSVPLSGPTGSYMGYLASLTDVTGLAMASAVWQPELALVPNPARTTARLTVLLPDVSGALPGTLTLTDALGRTVLTQPVRLAGSAATAEVPLHGLMPGFYQVRVQAGALRMSRTLSVE